MRSNYFGSSLRVRSASGQKGVVLVISLIMLVLITVVVLGALLLSTSNLKSASNLQVREEGIAAANLAIEDVISSSFTTAPAARDINIDIDKDGKIDYVVKVDKPTCIKAFIASSPGNTQVGFNTGGSGNTWNTEWDINAAVVDTASGASVSIRQGVRARLSGTEKDLVCP